MATPRTFTISLPPKLARRVDELAAAEGRTRSELFREAVRQYLTRQERWAQIFAYGEAEAKKRGWTEADVDQAVADERHPRQRS